MATRLTRFLLLLILPVLLAGCNAVVMAPSGDIAMQQRDLIVIATVLMLLIVVPVMVLTGVFAWRYRASNTKATHTPDWHHSTQLELLIWAAPLLIVIVLGAITWTATHTLDPYRKIGRIDATRPLAADVKPLKVQVVALDWKWLFFYPDYGIASVNELAAPVDVPIEFQITASTVMNSFFIPALAGQIYAMPGMETRLHAVINKPGNFEGFSANYSGAGFSHMRFNFAALNGADFDRWVADVRAKPEALTREVYQTLEKPSEREPVRHYGSTMAGLYDAILNLCVDPNKMCMKDMMAIDARGGLGLNNVYNVARLSYDAPRLVGGDPYPQSYVLTLCQITPDQLQAASSDAPRYSPLP